MDKKILAACAALTAGCAALSVTRAQEPAMLLNAATDSYAGCGLQEIDGRLWGFGPDYKARFSTGRFEFTPALGKRAAENRNWSFRIDSVRRGTGVRVLAAAALPEREDTERLVTFQHAGFVEQYELRPAGVAQSFTFDTLPAGRGDLIVRGRVETELPLCGADADGLRFELDGVGGVHVGAVTGIDAAGRRARGALRYADGMLELSLPGHFVDRAALPLVLDPLIGSVVVYGSGADDQQPDVAFDGSYSRYLVVWSRCYSTTNCDVMGRLVASTGPPLSPVFAIRVSSRVSVTPRVAAVVNRSRFVVVWTDNLDIMAASVSSANRAVSPAVTVAGGSALQLGPDVGGEATTRHNEAIVVWKDLTARQIRAMELHVYANGTLNVTPSRVLSGDSRDGYPEISRSGGATGRYLVLWERNLSGASKVYGRVIDRQTVPQTSLLPIAATAGDHDAPDVDGDGTRWLVAYEKEPTSGSGNNDIATRLVTFEPTSRSLILGSEWRIAQSGRDERLPAVSAVGDSYLVGFQAALTPPDREGFVVAVDPIGCRVCEPGQVLEVGSRDDQFVAIASQQSGDPNRRDAAMVVWQSEWPATGRSEVRGRTYAALDGEVTDLGGGCGGGGQAWAMCARAGNREFAHSLQGAAPGRSAYLILGFERRDLRCGVCRFVADPFLGFVLSAGSTDGAGHATLPMSIPNDPSLSRLTLIEQWAVVTASPSCALLGVDLSNALAVEID